MSYYHIESRICGVPCAMVRRGIGNGRYVAVFERCRAGLDQIKAIDWDRPVIEPVEGRECLLPVGYGYAVTDIQYRMYNDTYEVTLEVQAQYLGDVTGYAVQVEELMTKSADQRLQIAQLQDQLSEADEAIIALYEASMPAEEAKGEEVTA